MEAHNGSIVVESCTEDEAADGQATGTTFLITMPRQQPDPEDRFSWAGSNGDVTSDTDSNSVSSGSAKKKMKLPLRSEMPNSFNKR